MASPRKKCGHLPERRGQRGCLDCEGLRIKRWRRRHPEAHAAIDKRYRAKHREARLAQAHRYYLANAVPKKAKQRAYYRGLKDAAYEAYGGYRCRCCGETEPVFLCLDHINDDGASHRKEIDPAALYIWLKHRGYPPTMQVLCQNCNTAKRYGPCPHTRTASEEVKAGSGAHYRGAAMGRPVNCLEHGTASRCLKDIELHSDPVWSLIGSDRHHEIPKVGRRGEYSRRTDDRVPPSHITQLF